LFFDRFRDYFFVPDFHFLSRKKKMKNEAGFLRLVNYG